MDQWPRRMPASWAGSQALSTAVIAPGTPDAMSMARGSRSMSGTMPTTGCPTSSASTSATCARKIDHLSGVQYLETVRGAGYRLRAHGPAGPG
jgi:hypothetical protein